jgi:hypothetical protein
VGIGTKSGLLAVAQYLDDSDRILHRHEFLQKEIKFNVYTEKYIEDAWESIRKSDGDILAVMSRGSDFRNLKPKYHYIQPEPDILLTQARNIMDKHNIRYCFLSTEEKFAFDMFKKEFGEKLLGINSVFFDEMNKNNWIIEHVHDRKNAKYRLILEYLTKIIIASRCDYLLCGINSGSVGAIEFNGGCYKKKYVINMGIYE